MKQKLFFLIFCFCVVAVWAQRPIRTESYYLGGGGSYPQYTELNKALEKYRNTELSGSMLNFEGGYQHFSRRWILGAKGNLMAKGMTRAGGSPMDAYMRFLYGGLTAGFVPFEYEKIFFAYPTISIGGGSGLLKRLDADSGRELNHRTKGWIGEGALNFTMIKPMPDNPKTNFVLGVCGGYLYTPQFGNTWQAKLKDNATPVRMSPAGGFFRIIMGMSYGR